MEGLSFASYSVTCQPRAWAASTAPFDGTALLLAACPAEITTMVLPFAAGRDAGATFVLVPLYSCSTALVAFFRTSLLLELAPDAPDDKTVAMGTTAANATPSRTVRRMVFNKPVINPPRNVFPPVALATSWDKG